MTPKEKAEELVNKYDLMQTYIEGYGYENAKQSALIAVDEILDLGILYGDAPFGDCGKRFYSYWLKVKQEIENL